jgi:adenine deaminase
MDSTGRRNSATCLTFIFWKRSSLKMNDLKNLISVARGKAPADLLLTNAKLVNTFTGEIEQGNVAIYGDRIAGVGDYKLARETIDLKGKCLAPGFINGHTHIESSMLDPIQYARAVVPHGTVGVVTDLHEITNVCGLDGIKYVLSCAHGLPLDLFLMVPSCVPATHLETSGAKLTADGIQTVIGWNDTIGLGEMMNFPGVIAGDGEMLLRLAVARWRTIDGHAPGLSGKDLQAYIAAGILSDHECTTLAEAQEKLRLGMHIMIREGSSEKNLEALLPLVTDKTYPRCLFVVDDRTCSDLLNDGDIDAVVRKAISMGLDPVRAIQMVTINAARYFWLDWVGAIAPGYFANLVVIEDFSTLAIESVFYRGQLVARGGKPLFSPPKVEVQEPRHTVNIKPFTVDALRIPAAQWSKPVIELVPDQIVTRRLEVEAKESNGFIVSDTERDILKLVVVERHKATGNTGLGLVKGFGLKRGALASSIAHDSHNIVAVGASDEDIFAAIKEIESMDGGLVAVAGDKSMKSLPLPIAGLLSDKPLELVVSKLEDLERAVSELGCKLSAPFATLSFLALPVIPELRLTDMGLVDVSAFRLL